MPSAAKFEWPQGQPLFEVQWRSVAESLAGNGVRAPGDLEVTATGTSLEIAVSSGTAYYLASESSLGSAETHTLSSGDSSDDRWDTVYFDTDTGSSGVREGTPDTSPEPPDIQGQELLLAIVYVPATASDVPDNYVLNWRAQFSNEAEETHYDDSTGTYSVNSVADALDELQEAAQLSSYPLSISTDTEVSTYPLSIATDTEASAYPLANSDIENSSVEVSTSTGLETTNAQIELGGTATISITNSGVTLSELNSPFALPDITDMDASGNSLTDSAGPGTIYDANTGEIVQSVLGGPSSSLTSYPLPIGDLNSPYTLPNITDMDVAGNDLDDSSGPGTLYDSTNQVFVQSVLGGPASDLSAYPLQHGTDTDTPTTAHHTELASGTFTHTTGGQTTQTIVVGTNENQRFDVVVSTDTGVAADYAYSVDWYRQWDNANGNLEVAMTVSWETDPGSDITLAYSVQER